MIDLVSESLRTLLDDEMTSGATVTLLSPSDTHSATQRVNLFLFRVEPSAYLNNRDWIPSAADPTQITPPPLALNLYYLLTAHAAPDDVTGQAGAHALLADAMRVLYEFAVLRQPQLETGLHAGEVKVSLLPENVDQLSKLWTAFDADYLVGAVYEVAHVDIRLATEGPIPERVRVTDVTVQATDGPPALTGADPRSGAAGSALQVTGERLGGWIASVKIGGVEAGDGLPLRQDQGFTVTVPAALAPGTYELDVDVAGLASLHRAFEVTP